MSGGLSRAEARSTENNKGTILPVGVVLGSESGTWGWRGPVSLGESPFHLLAVSSNGGAKTKLLGLPWITATQTREGGGGIWQQLWVWSVISVGSIVQHNSCPMFTDGYEEDDNDFVRTLAGLMWATTALIVSPQLSPTLWRQGFLGTEQLRTAKVYCWHLNPTPRHPQTVLKLLHSAQAACVCPGWHAVSPSVLAPVVCFQHLLAVLNLRPGCQFSGSSPTTTTRYDY